MIDTINQKFEKEKVLREKNINKLNKQLKAIDGAFAKGQITANDFYTISNEIEKRKVKKMEIITSKDFIEEGKAIKKPIPISFMVLEEKVAIHTREGVLYGEKGDYLLKGIQGEIYPCGKEIFEATYDISKISKIRREKK